MTVKWKKAPLGELLVLLGLFLYGIGLLVFTRSVSGAVAHALELCTDILLPSLFPFLVLSSFLVSSAALMPLLSLLERPMHRLFCLPGCCSAAILLGAIGGYPIGARTVSELYTHRLCSKKDAERTLLFCNNAGPAFLIGVIGTKLLNDSAIGCLLYLIHVFSALLIGFLLKIKHCGPDNTPAKVSAKADYTPLLPAFLQAVTGSFQIYLNICAFVLLFSVILCLLQQSGLLHLFLHTIPGDAALWNGLICGTLELTSGADILTHSTHPRQLLLPALSFLCGWGGLSVQMQTIILLHDANLPVKRYLFSKIVQGILCALLTIPFCR